MQSASKEWGGGGRQTKDGMDADRIMGRMGSHTGRFPTLQERVNPVGGMAEAEWDKRGEQASRMSEGSR